MTPRHPGSGGQAPFGTCGRRRLPDRRRSAATDAAWRGGVFVVQVGFFDDGRPGEVFAKGRRERGEMGAMVDKACILMSRLLQRGCPVSEIVRDATKDPTGEAETPLDAVMLALASLAGAEAGP